METTDRRGRRVRYRRSAERGGRQEAVIFFHPRLQFTRERERESERESVREERVRERGRERDIETEMEVVAFARCTPPEADRQSLGSL